MRARSAAVVALVLAAVGASCGDEAQEESLTPVRVGVIQASDQLALFVMHSQGFDVDHGIRLELRTVQSGGEAIGLVAEGATDAGLPGISRCSTPR